MAHLGHFPLPELVELDDTGFVALADEVVEAADTDAPICCSDRNGDCRIVYDLYFHSLSAAYFCRS